MTCGYIYKIVFPNGKHYIGLTTTSLEQRTKEHKKYAKNGYTYCLYNALRKYGMVDTLKLIEIDTADTIEELCEKEIEYIIVYNSFYMNKNGYNMTYGGEGTNGYVYTEAVKQKMSEIMKKYFEENPEAGKEHGERMKKYYEDHPEAREQMSEIIKKYYEDNPEAGKEHGEQMKKYYEDHPEAREQQSEIKKKYYKDHPEAIEQRSEQMKKYYEDNPEAREQQSEIKKKYFEDHPEAGKEHSERMKKHYEDHPEAREQQSEKKKKYYEDNPEARKEHGKRIKKHYEENPEFIKKILDMLGKNKPFDVFKIDGIFIKTFTYQFEAKKYLQTEYNITSTLKINEVLAGNRKTTAGFVFKYK